MYIYIYIYIYLYRERDTHMCVYIADHAYGDLPIISTTVISEIMNLKKDLDFKKKWRGKKKTQNECISRGVKFKVVV